MSTIKRWLTLKKNIEFSDNSYICRCYLWQIYDDHFANIVLISPLKYLVATLTFSHYFKIILFLIDSIIAILNQCNAATMVLIDYFEYIWCYKPGRPRSARFDQFSCEVVSLNLSVYLLTFGIVVLITGVVVREVSSPMATPEDDSPVYGIGTMLLIFGAVLVWFGFILLGSSLIKFHCKGSHMTRRTDTSEVSLYSIYNNGFSEVNTSPNTTEDQFDWDLERPPPYTASPIQTVINWQHSSVINGICNLGVVIIDCCRQRSLIDQV